MNKLTKDWFFKTLLVTGVLYVVGAIFDFVTGWGFLNLIVPDIWRSILFIPLVYVTVSGTMAMLGMARKPVWLKPEIDEIKYWFHLGILGFIVLFMLQGLFGGEMLTIINWLTTIPILAVADVVAHTVLQLD